MHSSYSEHWFNILLEETLTIKYMAAASKMCGALENNSVRLTDMNAKVPSNCRLSGNYLHNCFYSLPVGTVLWLVHKSVQWAHPPPLARAGQWHEPGVAKGKLPSFLNQSWRFRWCHARSVLRGWPAIGWVSAARTQTFGSEPWARCRNQSEQRTHKAWEGNTQIPGRRAGGREAYYLQNHMHKWMS